MLIVMCVVTVRRILSFFIYLFSFDQTTETFCSVVFLFLCLFVVEWIVILFQVSDFSLSSFLGHLESPLKTTIGPNGVQSSDDTRLSADVSVLCFQLFIKVEKKSKLSKFKRRNYVLFVNVEEVVSLLMCQFLAKTVIELRK